VTGAAPWVGRRLERFEDAALVRGEGLFTADLPAQWRVRFVRSPIARGTVSVSTPAGWPSGAHLVTLDMLSATGPIRPMLHRFGYVPIAQPLLSDGRVRYVGDLVAAVVARTEEQAEDLADTLDWTVAEEDAVVDARAALAPGAPAVHAAPADNCVVRAMMETPGFVAAREAASHRVAVAIRSGRQSGQPIEARAAHAAWGRDGRITLHCTTQMPHLARTAIADLLGMAEADLRVVAPDVGGGFGQKMSLAPEYAVVVAIARRLRASVAWTEDRRENLMASFHSRDMEIAVEAAFDAEGRLLALDGDVLANVGAYAPYPNTAAVEPLMSLAELPGPYAVAEYRCTARGAVTNTCPSAPYRGVARPAITLAMERLMDRAAATLGLDPAELRRRNLVREFPHTTPTGLIYDEGSYVATMEQALAAAEIPAFRARQAAARAEGRLLGLGLSVFCERTGYGTPAFAARAMEVTPGEETVQLAIDPSGFVEARIGASPHGQGLRTTLAQIVADAVGVTPDRVRVTHGDTDRTPYGWGTFASRSLVIAGGACLLAGQRLRATLTRMAAEALEAAEADIAIADGEARVVGTDRSIRVPRLARAAHHGADRPAEGGALAETARYDPLGTFSNAAHVAIVELDPETGAVTIERFIVAEDAGRLINPMIVDGQIAGGVAQGIANALYEEIVYAPGGDVLTTTLADYLVPTAHEIPPIEIHHLVTESDATLTRAKGVGEGGTIGAPAAVLNAINDALAPLGACVDAIPATPMRIKAALRAAGHAP
jgi:carbon-monoxide dehydrogenase large subunit